jgi:hypothetical protein
MVSNLGNATSRAPRSACRTSVAGVLLLRHDPLLWSILVYAVTVVINAED